MHVAVNSKSLKLFSLFRNYIALRTMAVSKSEYLINDSKYSFLKELGLQETNLGVFDGAWKGSGQVNYIFFYLKFS